MIDTESRPINRGDRVVLTNADPDYSIGSSNPLVGTKFECAGVYKGDGMVDWENGFSNGYKSRELTLVNESCVDIWPEI